MRGVHGHGSSEPDNFSKAVGRSVSDVWDVPFFASKIGSGSVGHDVISEAELDDVRREQDGASFIQKLIDTPEEETYSMLFYLPDEDCFFRKEKDSSWFSGRGSGLMRYIKSGCRKYLMSNAFMHDMIYIANQVSDVVDSVPEKVMSSDAPYVELCNLELNIASDKINSLKETVSKLDPKSEGYVKGHCLIAKMIHSCHSAAAGLELVIWRSNHYGYGSVIADKRWPLMSAGVVYPKSKVLDGHKIKNAIMAELKKHAEVYTKQPSSVVTKAVPVREAAFRKKASHLGLKLNLPRRTLKVSEMPITLKYDSDVSSVDMDEKVFHGKAPLISAVSGGNTPFVGAECLGADDLLSRIPAATELEHECLDSFGVAGKALRPSHTHVDTPFFYKETSRKTSSRLL